MDFWNYITSYFYSPEVVEVTNEIKNIDQNNDKNFINVAENKKKQIVEIENFEFVNNSISENPNSFNNVVKQNLNPVINDKQIIEHPHLNHIKINNKILVRSSPINIKHKKHLCKETKTDELDNLLNENLKVFSQNLYLKKSKYKKKTYKKKILSTSQ
jgi:hypothetical protein